VFLPDLRNPAATSSRLFYASLSGETIVYPFDVDTDTFIVDEFRSDPIVEIVNESRFEPREWHLRTDATHGKSKTKRRAEERQFPHPGTSAEVAVP